MVERKSRKSETNMSKYDIQIYIIGVEPCPNKVQILGFCSANVNIFSFGMKNTCEIAGVLVEMSAVGICVLPACANVTEILNI